MKSIRCSIGAVFAKVWATPVSVLLMMRFPTKLELLIDTWLLLNTLVIGKHEDVLHVLDVVDCLKEEIDFSVLLGTCISPQFIVRMLALFTQIKST